MKQLTDLEYLRLSRSGKFLYKLKRFFLHSVPQAVINFFKRLWNVIKKFGLAIKNEAVDIWTTFRDGTWQTKVSYLIMGFGSIARGQILR